VNKLIAISESTARDLRLHYQIPSEKIEVIHHGISKEFHHCAQAEIEAVRAKYHLPEKYLLHVGRIDVRKNLTRLAEAFNLFKKESGFSGKLVLVGEEYKKCPDKRLIPTINRLGLEKEVIFAGGIPEKDLSPVYSGATAFVFPSLHEGFGLVTLEAMACQIPVITHKSDAVSEVVGDAAMFVDAEDVAQLAHAMGEIIQNEELRNDLINKGVLRARQFTWECCAQKTLNVYSNVFRA